MSAVPAAHKTRDRVCFLEPRILSRTELNSEIVASDVTNPTVHATVTNTTAPQGSAQAKSAKKQRKKYKKAQKKNARVEDTSQSSSPSHPHPDGRDYIHIHEIYEVYGCSIPLQAFWNTGVKASLGTRVTAEEVECARENLEGAELARGIDTQWGLIPGGGAYKESNRYFGPGPYDYY